MRSGWKRHTLLEDQRRSEVNSSGSIQLAFNAARYSIYFNLFLYVFFFFFFLRVCVWGEEYSIFYVTFKRFYIVGHLVRLLRVRCKGPVPLVSLWRHRIYERALGQAQKLWALPCNFSLVRNQILENGNTLSIGELIFSTCVQMKLHQTNLASIKP